MELRRVAAEKRAAVHKALRAAERENDREKYLARVRFEVSGSFLICINNSALFSLRSHATRVCVQKSAGRSVHPALYVSGQIAANNYDWRQSANVRHIVNVTTRAFPYQEDETLKVYRVAGSLAAWVVSVLFVVL